MLVVISDTLERENERGFQSLLQTVSRYLDPCLPIDQGLFARFLFCCPPRLFIQLTTLAPLSLVIRTLGGGGGGITLLVNNGV
jgi:hypothetical protein